ncbi:MAG: Asp-tRNA(Asn)/Glu-tRNA(Gln) amidotransferase subunit GatC [Amoebophilaceae bacterium]|jgi:aspartyl-tRNA(Asn)/glutamyl-tRNA(Gln) amidotransferase subunit C|nr:Asp-tRNA(Asn)/Glu-tRNA(Gln) amidotransferase subunit GatC [Amoebophilaceae bacterium]
MGYKGDGGVYTRTKLLVMKIGRPLLQKLAQLAQLEVDVHNEPILLEDLNKIVDWAEKLKELDTTGVNPLVTMASEYNIFQEDTPQAPLAHAKALANAPSRDSNYFRVPKVKE